MHCQLREEEFKLGFVLVLHMVTAVVKRGFPLCHQFLSTRGCSACAVPFPALKDAVQLGVSQLRIFPLPLPGREVTAVGTDHGAAAEADGAGLFSSGLGVEKSWW